MYIEKAGPGKLRIARGNVVREISVVLEKAPSFPDTRTTPYPKFLISLIAPNPFWIDPTTKRQDMADWVGGLQFPLTLPTMFSGRSTRTNSVVQNGGDVETPVLITFRGGAINPRVILVDTGAYVEVRREILPNESLVINTEFGNKQVLLVNNETGETKNAFAYIDPDSEFFSLHVGSNQLNYSSELGVANTLVEVRWKERFLGV